MTNFSSILSWSNFWPLVSYIFILILIIFLIFCIILRLASSKLPNIIIYHEEKHYYDPINDKIMFFPSLTQTAIPEVYLSVIVPAYNEEQRLPLMLEDALNYLKIRSNRDDRFSYEIIIVDDGSRDKTTKIGLKYAKELGTDKIRVLTLKKNRGKGGAVRLGILFARGELILFADADGATKFEDFEKLEKFMTDNRDSIPPAIAIGSRAHLEKESIASRSLIRTILMYGFHLIVWLLTVRTIRDTQCGFKLFGREIAKVIFTHIHVERWAFDVELLLIAEHLQCKIGEIPVNWKEIEGSKIIPFWSWIQMGKDVALIFLKYTIGAWSLPKLNKANKVKHN